MNSEEFERRLSAILSADVAGYSRLIGEDDNATVRTLNGIKPIYFISLCILIVCLSLIIFDGLMNTVVAQTENRGQMDTKRDDYSSLSEIETRPSGKGAEMPTPKALPTDFIHIQTEQSDDNGSPEYPSITGRLFHKGQTEIIMAFEQINSVFQDLAAGEVQWSLAIDRISRGKGLGYLIKTLLIAGLLILSGIIVEKFVMRFTEGIRNHLLENVPQGIIQKVSRIISRILLDIIGISAYVLTTYLIFPMIYKGG